MKQLSKIISLTLAMNFIAVLAALAVLALSGKLNREKVHAISEIVFPATTTAPAATQASATELPTSRPMMQLEELLAKRVGRTASEQVEVIQHSFDEQMAILDRRQRELVALQDQIEAGKKQLSKDRAAVDADRKTLEEERQKAVALLTDKGFQDCLALYKSMSGKQVKAIFMTLDETIVMRYLQAMEPRKASGIIKEFKTPEETDKIQKILERLRQAQLASQQG